MLAKLINRDIFLLYKKKMELNMTQDQREAYSAYLFMAPFLIIFLIFLTFPIFYSFYLSFSEKASGYAITNLKFVGLKNYFRLFSDPQFGWSLLLTACYAAISIPLGIAASLSLALLLHNKLAFKNIFRSAFFLPNVLDMFVVGMIWKLLYTGGGVLAKAIGTLGINASTGFLGNPWIALPAIAFAMVLKGAGFGMVLFLAALQNIPESLYEAASIDGASAWHRFKHITVPMLKPIFFFMIITGTIGSLNAFTEIYAMTDDAGPYVTIGENVLGATKLTGYYLFQKWQHREYGYAAAMSFILLIITLAVSFANKKLLETED